MEINIAKNNGDVHLKLTIQKYRNYEHLQKTRSDITANGESEVNEAWSLPVKRGQCTQQEIVIYMSRETILKAMHSVFEGFEYEVAVS
jgi:hypothetical protein